MIYSYSCMNMKKLWNTVYTLKYLPKDKIFDERVTHIIPKSELKLVSIFSCMCLYIFFYFFLFWRLHQMSMRGFKFRLTLKYHDLWVINNLKLALQTVRNRFVWLTSGTFNVESFTMVVGDWPVIANIDRWLLLVSIRTPWTKIVKIPAVTFRVIPTQWDMTS